MKYYIFKTYTKKNIQVEEHKEILEYDKKYISYNNYLQEYYGVTVEENEDYIPYKANDEVIMILKEGYFESTDLENVFEILSNELYKPIEEGDSYEKNYHSEWLS